MKRIITSLLALLSLTALQAQEVTKPGVKTPTSFAIIIDSASYSRTHNAVDAYRQSIEQDGLGTYLAVANWQSPEQIKQLLLKWHANKKQPLEGAVFVGDIPIPMVRDAQYLTSAFKMDQRNDWKQSSVASDRFYDDFSLKFDFLKRDADKPLYFYYSLSPDGAQTLSPDIYTGRIKPVNIEGKDKYELLNNYLHKVVRLKSADKDNTVDHLTMARGHGYNSEDRNAWADERMALRDQMPQLFKQGSTVKFIDFDTSYPAKNVYLNEALDTRTDILLFHHHGAPDTQYLNSYQEGSDIGLSIRNIRRYLHSNVLRKARKISRDSAVAQLVKDYGVPENWITEAFDKKVQLQDSLDDAAQDIVLSDIHALKPNARFVLFDACFNGSFYEDDYIAGAYIFTDGNTVATIGGTVNALQDKWPDEFIGLMASGMRIGQFNRFSGYLESHLIGDPTYHFKANSGINFDINDAIVRHYKDAAYWRQLLSSPIADVQAMALRMLQLAGVKDMPQLLQKTYRESSITVVRMEALKLLALYYPDEALSTIALALDDSYELARRLSAGYAQRSGSPELLPAIVQTYFDRGQEQRLGFKIITGINAWNADNAKEEVKRQLDGHTLYSNAIINKLLRRIDVEKAYRAEMTSVINDTTAKPRTRINTILRLRNNPAAELIPTLLKVAAGQDPKEVRIAAIHTLGWYDTNYNRASIVSGLKAIKTTDSDIKAEIRRSLARIK